MIDQKRFIDTIWLNFAITGCKPSRLWYKTRLIRQSNCWSLRYSWSIACRRCSNYIFILALTPDFKGLSRDNGKTRRESFKIWDLLRPILDILRYFSRCYMIWRHIQSFAHRCNRLVSDQCRSCEGIYIAGNIFNTRLLYCCKCPLFERRIN